MRSQAPVGTELSVKQTSSLGSQLRKHLELALVVASPSDCADQIITNLSKPGDTQRKQMNVSRLTPPWSAGSTPEDNYSDNYPWFLENAHSFGAK